MFDISHDPNRFFFPAVNKMSSLRLSQASSDPNLHSPMLSCEDFLGCHWPDGQRGELVI